MSAPPPTRPEGDWYRETFDGLYPILYAHRDHREAEGFLRVLSREVSLEDGRVLDLGCGPGRFLTGLAKLGARAVGVDLSLSLLERARACARGSALVRADMRALPLRAGAFRTVLMMFTTFGYFEHEAEDAGVLSGIAETLEPNGTLVLDTINPRHAREHLVTRSGRIVQGMHVIERRWIDPGGPFLCKETRVGPMRDGSQRTYHERLRMYEPSSLAAMLESAGLRVRLRWGDYQGHAFETRNSARLLLIAQRDGGA
jgi:2-polyprenyl-3-methyl-5-hydroxy-6-metoxy-1,4-benzoquinol methylase